MLQQCRHLFDHLVYGPDDHLLPGDRRQESVNGGQATGEDCQQVEAESRIESQATGPVLPSMTLDSSLLDPGASETTSRIAALLGKDDETSPSITFKQVEIIEAPAEPLSENVPMAEPVEFEEPGGRYPGSEITVPASLLAADSPRPTLDQAAPRCRPRCPFRLGGIRGTARRRGESRRALL